MDYNTLTRQTRTGDVDAARALEKLAKARGDTRTVILCWQAGRPAYFSAWNALQAALRAARKTRPPSNHSDLSILSTEQIRGDMVAHALMEAAEDAATTPLEEAFASLARHILVTACRVEVARIQTNLDALKARFDALLLASSDAELRVRIDDARAAIDALAAPA